VTSFVGQRQNTTSRRRQKAYVLRIPRRTRIGSLEFVTIKKMPPLVSEVEVNHFLIICCLTAFAGVEVDHAATP